MEPLGIEPFWIRIFIRVQGDGPGIPHKDRAPGKAVPFVPVVLCERRRGTYLNDIGPPSKSVLDHRLCRVDRPCPTTKVVALRSTRILCPARLLLVTPSRGTSPPQRSSGSAITV